MTLPAMATAAPTVLSLGDGRTVRLGELIGRGQAATVYRGSLTLPYKIRRAVAVKLFDPAGSDEAAHYIEAVSRTVRKTACVHHPNVVAPIEFTVVDQRPVIISEFVDGASLERLHQAFVRRDRKVPTDLALFIALEIAEGLVAAREARTPDGSTLNMRHHDLSPREVRVSWAGEVRITDFGVTAALRAGSAVRTLQEVAARCATMAPEVLAGERGDARSDVFSLGIILRQLLVGPRFPRDMTDSEKIDQAREGAIPIGLMEPPVREPMAEILQRALEVEPARRYAEPSRIAFDLRRACLSLGVGDGRVFLRAAMRDLLAREVPTQPTQPEPARRTKADSGEVATTDGAADGADAREAG